MNKKKLKICITGGGSGGHIIPAIVVAKELVNQSCSIFWIGSRKAKKMEQDLIKKEFSKIKLYHIFSGKLRRKKNILFTILSIQNVLDIFALILGIFNAFFILLKEKPHAVFSKGGFTTIPVVIAARIVHIPVFSHESDFTMGLANKINMKMSTTFFYSFPGTAYLLPKNKALYSSSPIRQMFKQHAHYDIANYFGFKNNNPIILVLGGSLGSERLNNLILESLPLLNKSFNIIHQTGKAKIKHKQTDYYKPFEFIYDNLAKIMQNSFIIVSRSGANLVFEIMACKTPAIFIPLTIESRGEQMDNARYFEKQGLCTILEEKNCSPAALLDKINYLGDKNNYFIIKKKFDALTIPDAEKTIAEIIINSLNLK